MWCVCVCVCVVCVCVYVCVCNRERERECVCVWAVDLHGFYLEVEREKAGKSLHTYANQ